LRSETANQSHILKKVQQCVSFFQILGVFYPGTNDILCVEVNKLRDMMLFCWDNFFAGFMASLGCKELAYANLREILNEATSDGFVPNFAYATGQCSADRSQPPVGSAMLLETYRIHREEWLVEEMYDGLLRWNRWFAEHRMNPSGALCWGSEKIPVKYGNRWESDGAHDTYGAALESGLDNSPMYDEVPFNRAANRLELEDVGLTGLYILDCRSLMELAGVIGRSEDIEELQQRMNAARAGLQRQPASSSKSVIAPSTKRRISLKAFPAIHMKSSSSCIVLPSHMRGGGRQSALPRIRFTAFSALPAAETINRLSSFSTCSQFCTYAALLRKL